MATLPTESAPLPHVDEARTSLWLQNLNRQKYGALTLALVLFALAFTWPLLPKDGAFSYVTPRLFSSVLATLASLLGACWTFLTARRARRGLLVLSKRHRLAWLLLGSGLLANGIGNLCHASYQLPAPSASHMPSPADIGFTLFHSLTMIGLLLLPIPLKRKRLGIHIVIDALITTLCLFGISWFLIINPMLIKLEPIALFSALLSISYPCWDVLLILALVLFVHQRVTPVLRPSLLIYSLGVCCQTWADAGYAHLASYHQYSPGMLTVDPFWLLASLLLGLAPLYQYHAIAGQIQMQAVRTSLNTGEMVAPSRTDLAFDRSFIILQSCMIYLPFTALLTLTVVSQFLAEGSLARLLDTLCTLVFFLLITHYVLATYENAHFAHEKEQRGIETELLQKLTASLSNILEMNALLNHVVTLAATELGFDVATLLLATGYERVLDVQSNLLAHTGTSDRQMVASWQITGQQLASGLPLPGRETEIRWTEAAAYAPTMLYDWHIEQHVLVSLFVPLRHQGTLQGTLAFSLRTDRRFTARERHLARAFAREVAQAIEHTHIHERARKNACFAQAMANVATRLNSVLATGKDPAGEIYHLICAEGANALSADLAILYIHHHAGQFVPQAAVSTHPEAPTMPQEWPLITAEDYQMLLHQCQKSILLHPSSNVQASRSERAFFAWPPAPDTPREHSRSLLVPAAVLHGSTAPPYAQTEPRSRTLTGLQEALRHRSSSTALLAPLFIRQMPVGLLILARTSCCGTLQKRAFTLQDLELAQNFADQAAIALTNARLHEQLRTAHTRMQELDQLKDQFMITASHELRTPLTMVQGYLELLEDYRAAMPQEQQQEFLEKASQGCEELALLLNNVTDASRLESEAGIRPLYPEPITLRTLVENVVDSLRLKTTHEQRDIQIAICPQLRVRADATHLHQVIHNLSANALKYSPVGTPLLFSARPSENNDNAVILSITDHGKGIAPRDQARLFQRFVRLESDLNSTVRGAGLGLYISRRLIEAMHGRIWIESTGTPGAGTTFCIQLPTAEK